MRTWLIPLSGLLLSLQLCACSLEPLSPDSGRTDEGQGVEEPRTESQDTMIIRILIGSREFKAELEDSPTGRAFLDKLPLTLDMNELNGNEKYCYGVSLPRNDRYFGSIAAGDLMLYSGNCVVLF